MLLIWQLIWRLYAAVRSLRSKHQLQWNSKGPPAEHVSHCLVTVTLHAAIRLGAKLWVLSCATFFLTATSVQSKLEKSAPQTAKLPPILGASRLIAYKPLNKY